MSSPKVTYDVFLSHALADAGVAEDIAQTIENCGLEVFTSTGLGSGVALDDAIRQALAESKAFVAVFSSESLSPMTTFELGAAMAWNRPVYAVAATSALSKIPPLLASARIYALSDVDSLVSGIKANSGLLTETEVDELRAVFRSLGQTVDRLAVDPAALDRLSRQFESRTGRKIDGVRLLWVLLRLRKQGSLLSARAIFELKTAAGDQFMFNLKAGNGEVILTSETYLSKKSAENGIASVKANAPHDERYVRKESRKGEPFFVLTATNGQTIGKSEMYSSAAVMENGIQSMRLSAPDAAVNDLTIHARKQASSRH
jgi:uncharacterized protein YegP (UPF0339 family)